LKKLCKKREEKGEDKTPPFLPTPLEKRKKEKGKGRRLAPVRHFLQKGERRRGVTKERKRTFLQRYLTEEGGKKKGKVKVLTLPMKRE